MHAKVPLWLSFYFKSVWILQCPDMSLFFSSFLTSVILHSPRLSHVTFPGNFSTRILIEIIVLCLPRYIYSLGCQVCFPKKTSIFIHSNLLANFFDCGSFLDVILDIKRCRPGQSGSWYHHGSYYCHSHGIPQKFCAKGTMLVVVHPYSLEV